MTVIPAVALVVIGSALAAVGAKVTARENPRVVLSLTHENTATRITTRIRLLRAFGVFALMLGSFYLGPALWPHSFAGPIALSTAVLTIGYFLPHVVITRRHNSAVEGQVTS